MKMAEEQTTPEVSEKIERTTIHFRIPPRMPSVYAHHLIVQESENEVLLSFFEVIPSIFTGEEQERIKQAQESGVTADCVARITVAKQQFVRFAAVLAQVGKRILEQSNPQVISESESQEENNAQHTRNDQ
jgi:hypothetical protein